MFKWWTRRHKPAQPDASATTDAASAVSEDKALVEYSEFVLVLSPEPLWQRWKKTSALPEEDK